VVRLNAFRSLKVCLPYDGPFSCPTCDQMLVVLPAYVQGHLGGALFVSAVPLFLCGLRGFALFFGAVLGWFPVIALDMFLIRTLFPLPSERAGQKTS
jgi:hypothetical protein